MKIKTIFTLFLIINLIFFTHIINIKADIDKSKINTNEHKILEINKNYKLQIYYPITKYKKLNNNVNKQITNYLKEFKNNIKSSTIPINQYYYLIILYEKYEYKNYISFVFHIEDFTGGAHPNHRIYTVVYDIKENKIININNLINKNKNFLKILSEFSRNELKYNTKIINYSMLYEGTKPIKENFNNFAFSKEGLIIFFPQYQVAPYSQGEFNIIIPYKNLKSKTNNKNQGLDELDYSLDLDFLH